MFHANSNDIKNNDIIKKIVNNVIIKKIFLLKHYFFQTKNID